MSKSQANKPPRLSRHLLIWTLGLFTLLSIASYVALDHYVAAHLRQQAFNYAQSIGDVAASLSVEAIKEHDLAQLQKIAETIYQHAAISDVSIYRENGQALVSIPEESGENEASKGAAGDAVTAVLHATRIPLIATISENGVTLGWFKLTVEQSVIHKVINEQLAYIKLAWLVIAVLIWFALIRQFIKHQKRVALLASLANRILKLIHQSPAKNVKKWFEQVKQVEQTCIVALAEITTSPEQELHWSEAKKLSNHPFLYCQFEIEDLDREHNVDEFNLMEEILRASLRSFALQGQGEVLSGCLIPAREELTLKAQYRQLILLHAVIVQQLQSLNLNFKLHSVLAQGELLTLMNAETLVTGVSLLLPGYSEIDRAIAALSDNDIAVINVNFELLGELVTLEPSEGLSQGMHVRQLKPEIHLLAQHQSRLLINQYQ
jgi:hypothetical protein